MRRLIALTLGLVLFGLPHAARAETPAQWADKHVSELVDVYRKFHQQPELSSQEEQTAKRLAEFFKQAGVEVHTGIGGYGIVGLIKNGPGPTLMLRTDLDALPVVENTGLVYASVVKVKNKDGTTTGAMHACGHDIHITNLIGVAQFLAGHKSAWSGTIMLVGQPAEEQAYGQGEHDEERWHAGDRKNRPQGRLFACQRRQRRYHDARPRRARRRSAHHHRPDHASGPIGRVAANARQSRNEPG